MRSSGIRLAAETLTARDSAEEHLLMPERRHEGLDGLRGVAAFSVFGSHVIGMLPAGRWVTRVSESPLHFAWDGTAAVDLFFVLSGFVLTIPFVGSHPRSVSYARFIIRRVFRIYPAYWSGLILAIILRAHSLPLARTPELSSWIQHFWSTPCQLGDIVRHLVMIGPGFDTDVIDPVIWSLVVEMRISLLFPLVIVLVQHVRGWLGGVIAFGGSIALSLIVLRFVNGMLTFLPLFVLGALMASFREAIACRVARLDRGQVVVLLVLAIVLYDIRFSLFGFKFNYYAADIFIGLGSAILVALGMARHGIARFLSSPGVKFIGKVSYSFYLIHLPILLFVTSRLYWRTGSIVLCASISLAAALFTSFLLYRFIECPFLALGRSVAEFPLRRYWRSPMGYAFHKSGNEIL